MIDEWARRRRRSMEGKRGRGEDEDEVAGIKSPNESP